MIYEQNKQKFLQKNFSFAIIQSENAMSVNNLSQQHLNHFAHQMPNQHMMLPADFKGKYAQQQQPLLQIHQNAQLQAGAPGGAVVNAGTAAFQAQSAQLKQKYPRKPEVAANSMAVQSKKSLNQDLSHLPFVPPAQQIQLMNLEEPLAIQGQQTSSGPHPHQKSFLQQALRNQQQSVGFDLPDNNVLPGNAGHSPHVTGMYHNTISKTATTAQGGHGSEAAMLKTLVVNKLNDDGAGDNESLIRSQSKKKLKKQLRVGNHPESAAKQSRASQERQQA